MAVDEFGGIKYPHSVEAEQSVLGAMLISPQCIPQVMSKLRPEDFYMRQNQEIYEVCVEIFNESKAIDTITLVERMKQRGVYDENTTRPYLKQLLEITLTAANVMAHVEIVMDKALLRRVADVASEVGELVQQEGGTAQEILELAEQKIYAIRQGRSITEMTHIAAVMSQVWETVKERSLTGNDFPGISTGLVDLDRRIGGLNNSDLLILAARPGMGKTSLALNIGLEAGKHSGKSVAIFSLEMSQEQLGTE